MFDERNRFEFDQPDYPDEQLIAFRNPQLAKLRVHKREDLLGSTVRQLAPIRSRIEASRLAGANKTGVCVGTT